MITNNDKLKRFNRRSFVSFSLLFSFLWITISGLVLWIAPSGRISIWIDWNFIGLSKDQWQLQHTVFSYTFVVFVLIHFININWRTFINYCKSVLLQGLNHKKEMILSLAIFVSLFIGSVTNIPPFSTLAHFGDEIAKTWEVVTKKPPVHYAERLTIKQLSDFIVNTTPDSIVVQLKRIPLLINSPNQTLVEIAKDNNISPEKLFSIITQGKEIITYTE